MAAFSQGTVARNEALPQQIDGSGHAVLYDGSGVSDILIGSRPPVHAWLWNAELVLVAQHSEAATRAARLENLLARAAEVLINNPRPTPDVHAAIVSTEIDPVFQPADGVMPISVATLGVLLEYCTTNPTG